MNNRKLFKEYMKSCRDKEVEIDDEMVDIYELIEEFGNAL